MPEWQEAGVGAGENPGLQKRVAGVLHFQGKVQHASLIFKVGDYSG